MPLELHEQWMKRCLSLAAQGAGTVGAGVMVGSILIRNNQEIAHGVHRMFGGPHAERDLLKQFRDPILDSDILVVNLEPCAPHPTKKTPACTDIILERGIRSLIFGMIDPDPRISGRGIQTLKDAGVSIVGPILEPLARDFNRGFIQLRQFQRPWVSVCSKPDLIRVCADNAAWKLDGSSHLFAALLIAHSELALVTPLLTSILMPDPAVRPKLLVVNDDATSSSALFSDILRTRFDITAFAATPELSPISPDSISIGSIDRLLGTIGAAAPSSGSRPSYAGVTSVLVLESSPLLSFLGASCVNEWL